jgi:hypothetical protein
MLLDVMITGTANDLNGIEFVSRDVEGMAKSEPDQMVGASAR